MFSDHKNMTERLLANVTGLSVDRVETKKEIDPGWWQNTLRQINKAMFNEDGQRSWIYWTAVGATVFITIIILVIIYDMCVRYQQVSFQTIMDGGPPASAGSYNVYTVGIKADETGGGLDTNQTVIRVELLDTMNRYMGSFAVPTFMFKWNSLDSQNKTKRSTNKQTTQPAGSSNGSANEMEMRPLNEQHHQQQQNVTDPYPAGRLDRRDYYKGKKPVEIPKMAQEAFELRHKYNLEDNYRSMSDLHEMWSNAKRGVLICFNYLRRQPLDLATIRIQHDWWTKEAYLKLKYIVIYDKAKDVYMKAKLEGKPLYALHPCPPANAQLFPLEQITNQHFDEIKSFRNAIRPVSFFTQICSS